MLEHSQPRSLRACSRDDPECGARRGVLRRAARNRSPREARDPALQALRPGCEELAVTDPAQVPVREARPRSPKPPRWSAERRASRVISAFTRVLTRYGTQGASQAPDMPRYGMSNGCA